MYLILTNHHRSEAKGASIYMTVWHRKQVQTMHPQVCDVCRIFDLRYRYVPRQIPADTRRVLTAVSIEVARSEASERDMLESLTRTWEVYMYVMEHKTYQPARSC